MTDIQPHAFVGSGPGRQPTAVRGVIVCADCYRPQRSPVHRKSPADA